MSNTRTKTIAVILLTLILLALLPPATIQAAPVTQTGAVTAVTGWAYANSRGTGAGTYVVRAPVIRVAYGAYYTASGWVRYPTIVYRASTRQVTWQPAGYWADPINGFGYYALGLDTPIIGGAP